MAITAGEGQWSDLEADSGTLATGWHHVAAVIEPNNLRLFLDGKTVGKALGKYVLSDLGVTTNNWLGRSQYPTDAFFKGSMDDLRIYNYAMSQAEVAAVYAGREPELPDRPQWFFTVQKNELSPPEPPVDSPNVYYVPLKSEQNLQGQ